MSYSPTEVASYVETLRKSALATFAPPAVGTVTTSGVDPIDISLDATARRFLKEQIGNTNLLAQVANPFALSSLMADALTLLDGVVKLRTEALSVEAALVSQMLADRHHDQLQKLDVSLRELAVEADLAGAKKGDESLVSNVAAIATLQGEIRSLRLALSKVPGHPLNLADQAFSLRYRFLLNLQQLLAKLEAIRFVVLNGFRCELDSIHDQVVGGTGDPVPTIHGWMMETAKRLQALRSNERIVTLYRCVGLDNLASFAIAEGQTNKRAQLRSQLQAPNDETVDILLRREHFGLAEDEVGRLLAVGAVPVFGSNEAMVSATQVAADAPLNEAIRRWQSSWSFDLSVELISDVTPTDGQVSVASLDSLSLQFGGVQGWGMGRAAESVVPLAKNPALTDRPLTGMLRVMIADDVRSALTSCKRGGITGPGGGDSEQLKVTDILVGLQFAVVKRSAEA